MNQIKAQINSKTEVQFNHITANNAGFPLIKKVYDVFVAVHTRKRQLEVAQIVIVRERDFDLSAVVPIPVDVLEGLFRNLESIFIARLDLDLRGDVVFSQVQRIAFYLEFLDLVSFCLGFIDLKNQRVESSQDRWIIEFQRDSVLLEGLRRGQTFRPQIVSLCSIFLRAALDLGLFSSTRLTFSVTGSQNTKSVRLPIFHPKMKGVRHRSLIVKPEKEVQDHLKRDLTKLV